MRQAGAVLNTIQEHAELGAHLLEVTPEHQELRQPRAQQTQVQAEAVDTGLIQAPVLTE